MQGNEAVHKRQKLGASQVFLFDIEGTTTPITFVKDTLFPYARTKVKDYLSETWETPVTKNDVKALYTQIELDTENGVQIPIRMEELTSEEDPVRLIEKISNYVQWNIDEDRKVTALKQLQGHMWRDGYEAGVLKSQVYEDVPIFFDEVIKSGGRVAIYSSGSREAQHLLFKYSDRGDLRKFISCYFDTCVGGKRESKSYTEICLFLGVDKPSDVVFVTDILEEAEAARDAGITAVIVVRPGNMPLNAEYPRMIHNFTELKGLITA